VKKDMRRRVFPDFSWANIKGLPANMNWYFGHDVRSIHLVRPGHAYVGITKPSSAETSTREVYEVIKGTNGWTAHRLRTELNDSTIMR
jgi:hypothetical protein